MSLQTPIKGRISFIFSLSQLFLYIYNIKHFYSCRLTVKASCPMHLRKYPLDTQACPLEIGSCEYKSFMFVVVVILPSIYHFHFLCVTYEK